ncbi:unnamed protein product [Acanthoscelides obtectus]|uniref:CCHC-type domain-containing protein n=1 Tax=Acanthoscelides obtectus TaxID=200917 RepID=A0A9P0VSV8_ACAOB|nr:unnamed protein product [Acanthoscelides obtectus]CAH2019268.1 unnamed protein product [Acanthoscelides obtectus]CAH2020349.1 unnamed protein product [Acanthoscelides obtectus]CAH2021102.1 unnamed protein product [Acanthoscelides obtectus]CAK1683656.1 hypothetical protein AOBTE_LOCUS34385 [Acanthoscelides obtectus]
MDKIPAKHLIQKGRIVTTWSIWPVKERVSILRCFNCLEFGHRAERCTGADREVNAGTVARQDTSGKTARTPRFALPARQLDIEQTKLGVLVLGNW